MKKFLASLLCGLMILSPYAYAGIGVNGNRGIFVNGVDTSSYTTTGSVTAEHITSTDDATITDDLSVGGKITMGSATANADVFSMIQGAVASDPTFSVTQSGNNVTVNQTVGNMTLSATGDLQLTATGGQIGITGDLQGSLYSVSKQHEEIGILLDLLTAPKAIVGFTGTGATTSTEAGYESGAGRTWTYSGGLTTDKIFQGQTYVYSFDGVDSYLSTPDSADMSFGDGSNDSAFSVGGWVQVVAGGSPQRIMAKYDITSGDTKREWFFTIAADEKLALYLFDESSAGIPGRATDGILTTNTWYHVVATYDGTGGAGAASDPLGGTNCVLYVNGVAVASTSTTATYTAMENTGSLVYVGADKASTAPANFFTGDMGRLFVTGEELSAATVWKMYESTRGEYNK